MHCKTKQAAFEFYAPLLEAWRTIWMLPNCCFETKKFFSFLETVKFILKKAWKQKQNFWFENDTKFFATIIWLEWRFGKEWLHIFSPLMSLTNRLKQKQNKNYFQNKISQPIKISPHPQTPESISCFPLVLSSMSLIFLDPSPDRLAFMLITSWLTVLRSVAHPFEDSN